MYVLEFLVSDLGNRSYWKKIWNFFGNFSENLNESLSVVKNVAGLWTREKKVHQTPIMHKFQ